MKTDASVPLLTGAVGLNSKTRLLRSVMLATRTRVRPQPRANAEALLWRTNQRRGRHQRPADT
jgi:hypothetical protein